MAYSVGVRDTGSPSTVTVLVRSSRTMPPMVHAAAALLRAAAQLGIPAQLGTHPRQYLHRHKGLGDIVVRPHVQPQHLVLRLGLGGEQNDGRRWKIPGSWRSP